MSTWRERVRRIRLDARGRDLQKPVEKAEPPTSSRGRKRPAAAQAARLRGALRRVARIVLSDAEREALDSDRVLIREVVTATRRLRAQSRLAQMVAEGTSLEAALITCIRELLDEAQDSKSARSLAYGIGQVPGAERARRLAIGLVASRSGWHRLAWSELSRADHADLVEWLPVEAVETCLNVDDEAAGAVVAAVVDACDVLPAEALVDLAARTLAAGRRDDAARLLRELGRRGDAALPDDRARHHLRLVRGWMPPDRPDPTPADAVCIGVMTRDHPDRRLPLAGVGEHHEPLALLGSLARFGGVTFTGGRGLGDLVTELRDQLPSDLVLDGSGAAVHLVPVSRDFSGCDDLPQTTWTIAFGPHARSLFGLRYDVPYHARVRPIFVSFHVSDHRMLTPEAVGYLRRYGPVGCRDWATVDLLLSAGVDAFFSGSLTSTVGGLFPGRDPRSGPDRVGFLGVDPSASTRAGDSFEVVEEDQPGRDLVQRLRAAMRQLQAFRDRYDGLVTSRLDAYLAATSLGIPVDFRPRRTSDVRLCGLLGMQPGSQPFTEMRDGIRDLVAEILGMVLAGSSEPDVYARWRDLTSRRVREARLRSEAATKLAVPEPISVAAMVETAHRESRRFGTRPADGEVTDIALSLDQNLMRQFPVTLEALVGNASGALRLWVTCRGLTESYQRWVADAFPDVPMTFLPCDHVDYGEIGRMLPHITVTTMDRLLLPELLEDLERVTYVDIDAVALDDVCELAAMDLRGAPFAARTYVNRAVDVWRFAGTHLSRELGEELFTRMTARQPFEVSTFNAGVLVMDLKRMRSDRFSQTYVPWATRYGLNDQDVLLAYAGEERLDLAPRWNAWPLMEPMDDPGIVHFFGWYKPWGSLRAPGQEFWDDYQAASRARVGEPPVA